MANGKIRFGKQSGGVLGLVFPDGVTNTEVVLPESGTLASLESPAFTGTPTAPTPTAGDNSTKLATTAYVDGKMVLGTAVNSTSGTSIDFIGIPSWAKKITVMINGVSTNGTSFLIAQIGNTAIQTSGYNSTICIASNAAATAGTTSSNGFIFGGTAAVNILTGVIELNKIANNIWVAAIIGAFENGAAIFSGAGKVSLSGSLDRVRLTTVNGTDTFDAGSINIMYER